MAVERSVCLERGMSRRVGAPLSGGRENEPDRTERNGAN